MIKNVKQVLDRYNDYLTGLYDPFGDRDKKEVFLIILTLFEANVDFDLLISNVLNDPKYQKFEDVIKSHLLITDFYCFESFYLYKKDLIPVLIEKSKSNSLTGIRYCEGERFLSDRIPSFVSFVDELTSYSINEINEISKELFDVDLKDDLSK